MRAHRLEGSAFPYVLLPEPLAAFIVPRSPDGYVLRVQPLGGAEIQTSSLTIAEQLARGARSPQAIITFGPKDPAP